MEKLTQILLIITIGFLMYLGGCWLVMANEIRNHTFVVENYWTNNCLELGE